MRYEPSQGLPEKNNFYASFSGINKTDIKEAFIKNNWGCRKASWVDYELTNEWSGLILHGEEHTPLLSGAVIYNTMTTKHLDALFSSFNADYVYEFYGSEGNLLLEKKNDS